VNSYVYIVLDPSNNNVKIGWTLNIKYRLRSLKNELGRPVIFCKKFLGGCNLEKALHILFDGRRLSGEWFDDTDGLIRLTITGEVKQIRLNRAHAANQTRRPGDKQ